MKRYLVALCIFLSMHAIHAQKKMMEDKYSTLFIQINGIQNPTGSIRIAIYNKEDEWTGLSPFMHADIPIDTKQMLCEVKHIHSGTYGIILYQDENNNGIMDRNILGIPLEKYGFGNNAKAILKAPSFTSCSIQIQEDTTIMINL